MKSTAVYVAFLLIGLISAAPTSDNDKIIITKNFYPEEFVKYTAQHDIVKILLPLNNLNFEDSDDVDSETYIFFIEADTHNYETKEYKGLYVLKNDDAIKLLDNGRDIAATVDDTKTVYFAATDGLYIYNPEKNIAEKYGTITDSIISIAKLNATDFIYILTDDHILYKVTEEGTKKEKVDKVVDAQQIVSDYENNLYYYTSDKHVYVYTGEMVKKIEGLPSATYVNILNPPFVLENGVPVVLDNKAYIVYENGTSEFSDFEFVAKPTAYSMEATVIQYYAYNKKIYEYSVISLLLGSQLNELKDFLEDKSDSIQTLASKKGPISKQRSNFITKI